jgi:UPF0755 protein
MKTTGFVLLFLIVVGIVGGSRWSRLHKSDAIHPGKQSDLYLDNQVGLQQLWQVIADSLDFTHNKKRFMWAANLLGWHKFEPGHYKIDHNFTYKKFLQKLAKGNQDPISITIIPGQHKAEIISLISSRMQFDSSAAYRVLRDSSFMNSENINDTTLVGHLFPNTYQFYWTSSPKTVFQRIFHKFNQTVTKPFANRFKEINLSEKEVLALASIIQGEAVHNDEKAKISALYWNRLKAGMPLQADPTVEFALHTHRRLYFKDYKTKSSYNTYIHKGLPPGPVNNPNLSSIKAALFPADNDYLYMVARPDGYHDFAKTYAKHQQQSKKWHDYLKKMEKKAAASADSANS